MEKFNMFAYVATLSQRFQNIIKEKLESLNFTLEDIQIALCGRLVDLEDSINLTELMADYSNL